MRALNLSCAAALALVTLTSCGGGGSSPTPSPAPAPAPTPAPTPTPTPTPVPPSFFEGVTHFDAFDRADTPAGTVSVGPQGQIYEVFNDFRNFPDTVTRIRNKRLYTPPVSDNSVRASYTLTQAPGPVKRLGAILEYSDNTEATKGGFGYVWTLILSTRKARFTDEMIHFTGTHQTWNLEVWKTDGSRRMIASGNFGTALAYGQMGIVDLSLSGTTATVRVPGSPAFIVNDPDFALFATATFPVIEHYIPGNTQNIQQFRAFYFQAEGSPALPRSTFAGFEP